MNGTANSTALKGSLKGCCWSQSRCLLVRLRDQQQPGGSSQRVGHALHFGRMHLRPAAKVACRYVIVLCGWRAGGRGGGSGGSGSARRPRLRLGCGARKLAPATACRLVPRRWHAAVARQRASGGLRQGGLGHSPCTLSALGVGEVTTSGTCHLNPENAHTAWMRQLELERRWSFSIVMCSFTCSHPVFIASRLLLNSSAGRLLVSPAARALKGPVPCGRARFWARVGSFQQQRQLPLAARAAADTSVAPVRRRAGGKGRVGRPSLRPSAHHTFERLVCRRFSFFPLGQDMKRLLEGSPWDLTF